MEQARFGAPVMDGPRLLVEVLRCPSCGKAGEAQISAEDQLSWNFRVDAIPHGFKVIRIDAANSDYFFCASCDVPVEP